MRLNAAISGLAFCVFLAGIDRTDEAAASRQGREGSASRAGATAAAKPSLTTAVSRQ